MSDDENKPIEVPETPEIEENEPVEAAAERKRDADTYLRNMVDDYFLEYASYVIKDRAIPDVDDGLKPVQRRILWALKKADDGRTHKAANIIGNVMHYHPHGDASIGDALVVLANKEYFITKQGNFGNIFTGSPAAAPRYIECSLSPMGREVLFNDDITELVDSYDGRSQEPVVLPVKIPSLLMLGSDGIAVGMATKIMPHNFNELLQAQISVLKKEKFTLYPDFQQGGLMDAREYADGNGKIILRAKIDVDDKRKRLVITEIPATTTTESLIASIEKAADKNKIKISSVTDFTTDKVEIEVIPTRGYDAEKTRQALYMYTDCSVSISVNMTVICDSRPTVMSVTEVIERNTSKLLEYLKRELEIELNRQNELFHAKTLAQIFFENRIYKRIEECRTQEEEYQEVFDGLAPFRDQLRRDVTTDDVDKLLALPVRRISRFDIEKNQRELREINAKIKEIKKNLHALTDYAIAYLQALLDKYGDQFPRRTEIEHLEKIDRSAAALNNIKIGWDRKGGYIGSSIKNDDAVVCNEFDRFVCTSKDGTYKIIPLPPDKLFIGKLYDFRKYDAEAQYGIIYREVKSGKYYGKRSSIGSFILEKEYQLCPEGCKLELLTPRPDAIYILKEQRGKKNEEQELNLMELPERSARARGILIKCKQLLKITHSRYLTPEELELYQTPDPEAVSEEEEQEESSAAEVEIPETVAAPSAPRPDSEVEPEPETEQEAEPQAEAQSEPETESDVESEPETEQEAEPQAEAQAEPETESEVEPEIHPQPTTEPAVQQEVKPQVEPEPENAPESAAGRAPDELVSVAPDPVEPKAPKPRKPRITPVTDDPDDDLGIIQPEFGF